MKIAPPVAKPEPKASAPPQRAAPAVKASVPAKPAPAPALPVFAREAPRTPLNEPAPIHGGEKSSVAKPELAPPVLPPPAAPRAPSPAATATVPPVIAAVAKPMETHAPPRVTETPKPVVAAPVSQQASSRRPSPPALRGHIEPVKGRPGMPGFRGLATRSPIEGGGEPLVPEVKRALEASFDVNLDSVRVHYDGHAHTVAETLGARAFAYGNHIFLGAGESKADLGLLAHETAHVVQQQSVAAIQLWSPAQIDAYEYEADRASSAVLRGDKFSVAGRVGKPRVQRSLLSRLLDRLANWAYNIPGFRLLTVILGKNPINWSDVDRSAANILRGLVELIPGGHLLEEALDKYGVFEKLGGWLEQQVRRMESIGSAIKADWDAFVDDLDWTDIRHPGKVWDDAVGVFTRAVQRIGRFALDVGRDILKFIKDAILMPLAKLAEGTRGWDLLIAVLGKNPVTGEPVPRTAENLIGGFMKLIGQEEVWENIKKSHAIPRAWAWFQGALKGVISFVSRIPSLFIDALKSLTLEDIIVLPKAFIKVGKIFGGFLLDFISWAGEQVWTLLQIIFEVVAPAVMPYLKKAAAAFRTILKHPGTFVGHLVKAAKEGFHLFASHFLAHLQAALVGWLTGTLEGANIYIPQGFTFMEIIKFVLSVLGLTWQNIRAKLVKVMGETAVKALETGFDLVVTLVTQGPAAAWEKIQEGISNLKQMVIDGIMNFVRDRIVQAAVTKLLSMLSPAGAFIQAIIAIYNTVMFFIERLKQIGQVAAAFIDSISAIANGIIGPAAQKVESTLGGLLTLVVSFLARLVGLGKVSDAIKDIINKIRDPIDKALDRVVDWIVTMAKKAGKALVSAVTGGEKPAPQPAAAAAPPPQEQPSPALDAAHQQALDSTATAIDALIARQATAHEISGAIAGLRTQYHWTALDLVARPHGGFEIQGGFSPVFTVVSTSRPLDPRFVIMQVSNITSPAPSTTTPLKFEQETSYLMVNEILPSLFPRTTVRRRKERVTLTADQTQSAVSRARPGEALVYNEPRIPSVTGTPRSRTGVSFPDVFVLSKDFAISIEVTLRSQWNVDSVVPGEAGARIHKGAQAPSLTLNLEPHLAANPSLQLLLTIVSDQEPDERAQQWIERFLADKASGRVIGFVWLVVPSR